MSESRPRSLTAEEHALTVAAATPSGSAPVLEPPQIARRSSVTAGADAAATEPRPDVRGDG